MPQQPVPPPNDIPPWDPRYRQMQEAQSNIGPSLNILQRIFGPSFMAPKANYDIPLPNQSGEIDMRLMQGTPERLGQLKKQGGKPKSQLDEIQQGYNIFKKLGRQQ